MSIHTDVAVERLQERVATLENEVRELKGVLQAYVNELRTKNPPAFNAPPLPQNSTLKRATR